MELFDPKKYQKSRDTVPFTTFKRRVSQVKLEFEKIVYMNCGTSSKFSIVISEFRMGH